MLMRIRQKIQILLRTISKGALYPLLFPKFNLYFLWPFALIPLILYNLPGRRSRHNSKLRNSFFISWAAGTFANLIMLYWIYPTLKLSDVGIAGSLFGLILLAGYIGVYWGLFGMAICLIFKYDLKFKLVLIPVIWVLLEFVKTYLFSGFGWLLAGYSLWKITPLVQIANITGIYGLSFIVVFTNTAIALAIYKKKIVYLASAALLILAVFIYGMATLKYTTGDYIRISILQGNICQYKKWDSSYRKEILDIYKKLHSDAVKYNPLLIVWPESVLPGALTSDMELSDYFMELVDASGAYELVGSYERLRGKFYNSAYIVSSAEGISNPYRKIRLVPFGEIMPMRSVLSRFIGMVNEIGDFNRGNELTLLKAGDYKLATGICFESIYPHLARSFIKKGGDMFINISNDGWFLDTAGAYQHFIHSVIRAVENRVYVIRAANTGISAVISPTGRVLKKTNLLEEAVLNVKAAKVDGMTFYTRYGNVFVGICFLFMVFCFAIRKTS